MGRLIAATPTFWTVSTQADFLKGDAADLSIDSDGRMFLGPSASLVAETAAPFLWTVIASADGTLWAGSGNEGQVLKVGKDGKLSTFFDAPELEVHALAAAPNGGLYVGHVAGRQDLSGRGDGTSKTFFDPEDKYIWALAVDPSGNVFAATGDKGIIYRITPDGQGTRFYRTNAGNVVTLAFTTVGRPHRRHGISRARLPHRQGRARRSCCSTPRSARFTRCASPPTGRSTRWR